MTALHPARILTAQAGHTPRIILNPGDFHFGAAPLQLATLLGSCVTVTLWHPRRHIGGMCHFLLPSRQAKPGAKLDGHYAAEAFALFDQAIAKHASQPHEYQAKLFGGGDMFSGSNVSLNLGERNIAMARELLGQRGIPLLAEHAGGAEHRKLILDLGNGEVLLVFADQKGTGR